MPSFRGFIVATRVKIQVVVASARANGCSQTGREHQKDKLSHGTSTLRSGATIRQDSRIFTRF
jgi:hypothetical protein